LLGWLTGIFICSGSLTLILILILTLPLTLILYLALTLLLTISHLQRTARSRSLHLKILHLLFQLQNTIRFYC
jgi:hypothetical protein